MVMTDACQDGVGAILANVVDGTVLCASVALTTAERPYSQFEREALGVIFAMQKFHKYVCGRSFKIYTDSLPVNLR